MKLNPKITKSAAAVAVGGVLIAAGLAAGVRPGSDEPDKTNNPPLKLKLEDSAPNRADKLTSSFGPVVRKVVPAVVQVTVSKQLKNVQWAPEGMPEDPFQWFFGNRRGGMRQQPMPAPRQQGVGSGVIVSPDGYIVTNNHVVDGADEVQVKLQDEREFKAKVIGRDPKTDIAVIKIPAKNLPCVELADSDRVEVGDVVLAIGDPFGIGQTVTMGIVSATGRGNLGLDYEDFIQTDAAINPGNSGGALVDSEGRLIGINTAILSRTGANNGIGFAVPVNLAKYVMEDLVKDGRVERGFLGVSIQNVTPAMAKKFDLKEDQGALVADVNPDSPAAKADLRVGDVVVRYNGQEVRDSRHFKLMVAKTKPGTQVPLEVIRDGESTTLHATVKELAEPKELASNSGNSPSDTEALKGVAVSDLDARTRQQLELPKSVQGAVISQIAPGSAAENAGLQPGDVITEINRHSVKSAEDAVRLTENPKDKVTLLRIWRDGSSRFVVVDESQMG